MGLLTRRTFIKLGSIGLVGGLTYGLKLFVFDDSEFNQDDNYDIEKKKEKNFEEKGTNIEQKQDTKGQASNSKEKEPSIPQRELGKTGVMVSLLGLGGGGILAREDKSEEAQEIVNHALDHGVNYIDTAPTYGASEVNIGRVIKNRRKEAFLATKTLDRSYDATMRLLENSLNNLQTDYIDLYQIHGLGDEQDLKKIFSNTGAVKALTQLKEEGVVKFLGITGHKYPKILLKAMDGYHFDSILIPLNAGDIHDRPFQNEVLKTATQANLGIVAMKVMAYGRIFHDEGITSAEEAINYTCTFPCSSAIIGVSGLEELKENINIVKNFQPLSKTELKNLEGLTKGYQGEVNFFKHQW